MDVSHNSERCSRDSHRQRGRIFSDAIVNFHFNATIYLSIFLKTCELSHITDLVIRMTWTVCHPDSTYNSLSFLINGPLREESTRHEWIPHTKGQLWRSLLLFLDYWTNNHIAGDLFRHFDGIFVYVSTKGFHFDNFPSSGAASEENFFKLWIIPFHQNRGEGGSSLRHNLFN